MRRLAVACAATLVLLAASCGNDGGTSGGERPSSTASIAIREPRVGDEITKSKFTVRLDLNGGRIVNVVSKDLTPDEGHVHVSIDGKIITQTFGLTQKLDTPKAGSHLLQAEFVAKDHGPFNPRVLSTLTFEVKR
jgi:hypothetical protein